MKLDPHDSSGNSTIYARLVVTEDSISPIDSRRVVLVDGVVSSSSSGGLTELSSSVFWFPFLVAIGIIGAVSVRERWITKIRGEEGAIMTENRGIYTITSKVGSALDPRLIPGRWNSARDSWVDGESLADNQFRRYVSLLSLIHI